MKQRLFVSFSGGKSSGYMLHQINLLVKEQYDIVVVFANTGWEREETLEFVDRCAKEWGIEVVWVEAVVTQGERIGTTHRVVNFTSASRKCEPFVEVIKKYGIPNMAYPHCTRELKLQPMLSYIRSLGWDNRKYITAIGLRSDEPRRKDKNALAKGFIYPLIEWWPADKQDVNDWWEDQHFSLALKEHEGNCKACWKKSLNKHFRLIRENPEIYSFTRIMEREHGLSGHNVDGNRRVFFRNNISTNALFTLAKEAGQLPNRIVDNDANSGCSESCEAFAEE